MDYSLLVGVVKQHFNIVDDHAIPRDSRLELRMNSVKGDHVRSDGGIYAKRVEGAGIYYFGIIDILQDYSLGKRAERYAKIYLKMLDGNGISVIDPSQYYLRFKERVLGLNFELDDE